MRAVHMPGHTRGHSVLMVEPGGIAFIGDIDLTGFGPFYGDACSDLRQFLDTLEKIEHMEARVWITYHHKGVITERFVREIPQDSALLGQVAELSAQEFETAAILLRRVLDRIAPG